MKPKINHKPIRQKLLVSKEIVQGQGLNQNRDLSLKDQKAQEKAIGKITRGHGKDVDVHEVRAVLKIETDVIGHKA